MLLRSATIKEYKDSVDLLPEYSRKSENLHEVGEVFSTCCSLQNSDFECVFVHVRACVLASIYVYPCVCVCGGGAPKYRSLCLTPAKTWIGRVGWVVWRDAKEHDDNGVRRIYILYVDVTIKAFGEIIGLLPFEFHSETMWVPPPA